MNLIINSFRTAAEEMLHTIPQKGELGLKRTFSTDYSILLIFSSGGEEPLVFGLGFDEKCIQMISRNIGDETNTDRDGDDSAQKLFIFGRLLEEYIIANSSNIEGFTPFEFEGIAKSGTQPGSQNKIVKISATVLDGRCELLFCTKRS